MLGLLTRKWRWRSARLLVVLYALCLVSPTAVLAFSADPAPAHCLTEDHHGIAAGHTHDDGSTHRHSDTGDDDRSPPGKCCGLFCLSALTPAIDFIANRHPPVTHLAPFFAANLSGRGSDRIDRPPRSLLPL
jgi:hypothetical protein